MRIKKPIFIVCLILMAAGFAYSQETKCVVSGYINDPKTKTSTRTFNLGQFVIRPNEDEVVKHFSDKESGVNVSVGILKVISSFKTARDKIKLRISFTGKPDDDFALLDGAEAESIYDENWEWLAVSDKVSAASQIYAFTLSCGRKK
jgi:hypothetical protein